jgi:outer membrane receptor protein involved in Fe transport
MKNLLRALLCLLIIGNYTLNAQESVNFQESGRISGTVKDSEKGTPLEADVKLFTGDTVFVKGTKCDSTGNFVLENIPFGIYKLEAGLIEYSSLTVDKIKLDASSPQKSFDTLKLKKQNVTTEEILVEDQKGLLNLSGDKKVFNVDNSTITKGGTAIDVLKKVPMVDVDMDDNVSLRGSRNVRILIDDKPSKFVSLKQIPADVIDKVEIITNPSAKYESEGVTGIINIVMKANNNLGFNGSLNFGSGHRDRYWGGINLNLKKSKWAFFGSSYLGSVSNYAFDYTGLLNYLMPVSFYKSDSKGWASNKYMFFQGGSEYEFVKSNTLGFEVNYNRGRWNNTNRSTSLNMDSLSAVTSYYNRNNIFDGLWEGYTASLYYSGKLNDEGRELSGDITYTGNKNDYDLALTRNDYDGNNVPLTLNPFKQSDNTKFRFFNLNAQLDYVHPFSKDTKLEAGYKGTFRKNDNDYTSDTLDYNTNSYVRNTSISNHFKLNENINAAYGVYSSTIAAFTYKLGLRVEQTNSTGELLTGGNNFRKNYIDFFPTVSVSYKLGDIHQLQLSYSRRITRPNIWRLNPFVNKTDPKFWQMGNPNLNPEYTDSYELSYMFFHQLISVTPMLFFRQSHDVISNYTYLVDDNVLVSTFKNAKGSKAYGLDLVLSSRALSWLNLNGTLSLYDTKFDDDPLSDNAPEEGFSWKGNIRAALTFTDLFNVELYYNYAGKKVTVQGENLPSQNLDIGISKTFFGIATLSVRASDIFKTMKWGQSVNTSGYFGEYRSHYDSRSVYVNLSLMFGNTKEYYQKKKKSKANTNEQNDQGQDNTNMGR